MSGPRLVVIIAAVILILCISYGLAVLGEPQSAWLWGIDR